MLGKDIYSVKYRAKADISLFAVIKNNGKVRVFARFYIITKVNFIAFAQHPHSAVPAYGDGFTLDLFDNADPYGVKIWHFFIPVKCVYCSIGKSLKIYIVCTTSPRHAHFYLSLRKMSAQRCFRLYRFD